METLVNPSADFWRARRVLLTGHSGFKGAWLTLWLERLGAIVAGYSLAPPSSPSLYEEACSRALEQDIHADVRDLDAVCESFARFRPQVVFHMAAQSLVRPSYADPVGTYATNVMGTVNVLEAARQVGGVEALLNVTSDKCYDNRNWHWAYRENEAMGGSDPYSSSKGCSELVTAAYRRSFFRLGAPDSLGTAVASVRAGNVVGGGDWALDRIVPDCMRAFSCGQEVVLRSPEAVRPWQYVLEPLSGYLLLAERLAGGADREGFAEGWNFGPADEDAWTVDTVVERLADLWGRNVGWRTSASPQPPEATFLKVDASKARALLGWRPRLGIGQALEWTVQWYRRHAEGVSARKLCQEQIARYECMALEQSGDCQNGTR